MSLNQTDTISCKYLFTKGDGYLPVFNDTIKLTQIKKMFHLIVDEIKLKELGVTHYKVIDKGLKGIAIDNGEIIGDIKLNVLIFNAAGEMIKWKEKEFDVCFCYKIYDKDLWKDNDAFYYFDARYTQYQSISFPTGSGKSYQQMVEVIEKWEAEGKCVRLPQIFKYEENYNELPEEMKQDSNFLEKLVKIKPFLIGKINRDLDCFKKLLHIAIEEIGVDALWEINDINVFKDIDIIVAALKSPYGQDCWQSILCVASEKAEYSKKIIEAGYNLYGDKVLDLDYLNLSNDRQVVESAISINGHLFEFVNQEFKLDKGIIKKAILNDANSFRFISESIKNDKSFILELVSINGDILSELSNDLKNDKEIVRHAMMQDISALAYATDRLRNDKEFIFNVLNENIKLQCENKKIMDSILKDFEDTFESNQASDDKYAEQPSKLFYKLEKKYNAGNSGIIDAVSDALKSDKEFVIDILKIDPWSVRSISETLKFDRSVMQIVFVSEPNLIEHYNQYGKKIDRDFIMDAVSINADVLKFIDTTFRSDIEIVKLAVSKKGELLKLASDELKNNRDVVSLALSNYPCALIAASENLKTDEGFLGLFYNYMVAKDPHTFINYEASLELFILLPENKQKNKQLLLCLTRGIWYYDDLYLTKYKSLIMKYHSNDIEFIKECMILEEYGFSFLTLIDYNLVKEYEDLMISAIQADIRNDREPIIWGGDVLINNVNFLKKVIEISPLYLCAIKSNENILEDVKLKF
jgi:hypothetical protein